MTLQPRWAIALSVVLFTACTTASAGPKTDAPEAPTGGRRLTLLYTNDMHAAFLSGANRGKGSGILAIDAAARAVRAEGGNVLMVDAGDVLSGHPVSAIEFEGVTGGALYRMVNLVGYDVLGLGNHDFDNGFETLGKLLKIADRPVVCANLTRADGSPLFPGIEPTRIVEIGGLKVGFMGLVLEKLKGTTARENTVDVVVESPIEAARRHLAALDAATDLIVVIAHEGLDADEELVRAVPGIDVIIAGHDHHRTEQPHRVGDTLIVEAGSDMRALGRLDLVVADDRVKSSHNHLITLPSDESGAGPELHELVAGLHERLDAELGVEIGHLDEAWRRNYYGESNLGDWVTDVFREATGAEVGFVNSGGLRKDHPAGTITLGSAMSIVPFRNDVCTFQVTGAQLKAICQHNAWAAAVEDHGILQVSGVAYTWRKVGEDQAEVVSVTVNGEPVDDARTYTCATSDFVVFDQPDKYLGLVPEQREHGYQHVQEVFIAAVRRQKRIAVATEGRIRQAR